MQNLGRIGICFDAAVVFFMTFSLLFKLVLAIKCNLDSMTFLVSTKTVTKSHVTKSNDFMYIVN